MVEDHRKKKKLPQAKCGKSPVMQRPVVIDDSQSEVENINSEAALAVEKVGLDKDLSESDFDSVWYV